MYIQFKLPSGAGGMAAGYRNMHLKKRVQALADLHNITVINWTNGYRCCFEFARASDYTLFMLAWEVKSIWDQYELIND